LPTVLDISDTVRRADEDRWLASRFAPAEVRPKLEALYALNNEIARTAQVVTQAAIGDIRLAWWREAIGEIYDDKPVRAHPVLSAFAAAQNGAAWPRVLLERLIEARGADLDAQPFSDWGAFDAYIDATAGNVVRLALIACGARVGEPLVGAAARAWGYAGLARAGRTPMAGVTRDDLVKRAWAAFEAVRPMRFTTDAFPALGYVTLAPMYLRALERGRAPPLLQRQFALIAASARGRF
jgi:phytoene synthase